MCSQTQWCLPAEKFRGEFITFLGGQESITKLVVGPRVGSSEIYKHYLQLPPRRRNFRSIFIVDSKQLFTNNAENEALVSTRPVMESESTLLIVLEFHLRNTT